MAGCQKGVPYEYIHQADMDTKELSKKSRHRQTICMVNKERETEGRDKYVIPAFVIPTSSVVMK